MSQPPADEAAVTPVTASASTPTKPVGQDHRWPLPPWDYNEVVGAVLVGTLIAYAILESLLALHLMPPLPHVVVEDVRVTLPNGRPYTAHWSIASSEGEALWSPARHLIWTGAVMASIALVIVARRRVPWGDMGFSRPLVPRQVWPSVALFGVLTAAIGWVVVTWNPSSIPYADLPPGDVPVLVLSLASAAVAAPLLEETLFRGLLYRRLRASRGPWTTILATSGLFTALHFPASPERASHIFVLGVLLAWLVESSHSLWPGMVAHGLVNTGVIVTRYARGVS